MVRERVEASLEGERAQLPPWAVVGVGTGIAAWFAFPGPVHWAGVLATSLGLAIAGFAAGHGRAEPATGWFALCVALGVALIWGRSAYIAQPRLDRPVIKTFDARVEKVEPLVARGSVTATSTSWKRRRSPTVRANPALPKSSGAEGAGGCLRPARLSGWNGMTWCGRAPRPTSSCRTAGCRAGDRSNG